MPVFGFSLCFCSALKIAKRNMFTAHFFVWKTVWENIGGYLWRLSRGDEGLQRREVGGRGAQCWLRVMEGGKNGKEFSK